jgi:hypothetical protein
LVGLLGKRNSAKDVEIIQNVHDHAVSLGARCDMQNMKMAEAKPVYLSASLIEDSLNERMDDVREAVQAAYPANVGQMAASMPAPSYTYVVAVYDDHVIINTDGTLYSVDYTVGKDGEVVLSDKQTEVKQAYVAASAVEDKPTTIVLEGGKWTIKSKDQLRRLGSHDTKQEAEEHEQAIARSLARLRAEPPTCSCQKH